MRDAVDTAFLDDLVPVSELVESQIARMREEFVQFAQKMKLDEAA